MSDKNFKVKKGLVVATSITASGDISSSGNIKSINITNLESTASNSTQSINFITSSIEQLDGEMTFVTNSVGFIHLVSSS